MIKKIALIVASFVFSVISIYGQQHENSLLWKISGNGLEQSSYLYGTFHLLCPSDLEIDEKVKQAFAASNQLVLELDFDDPSVMPSIQKNMVYRDGTTARDYLNEEEYKMAESFFTDSLNMPFQRMQAIKPFFLSSMTIMHFLGCQPVSFEQKLTGMAQQDSIEVKGLETVKDQIGFIDAIPQEMQKKMLIESIKKYDSSKMLFDNMKTFYLEENIDGLNDVVDSYMSDEYADFKKDLLTKRNKKWVPAIEELAKRGSSFIAVGAGHLPGKDGLIDLLRKAGYKVEAVK